MKSEHIYDPEFRFVSQSLKKAVEIMGEQNRNYCIDMPAGNGRNIFYLSKFFANIKAVDIRQNYLEKIIDSFKKYDPFNCTITTSKIDLANDLPIEVQFSDFICTIHYYSYSLLSRVIEKMKKNSYYFIETPNCNGHNFLQLPTEREIDWLLKDVNVMFLEKNSCKSNNIQNKNISFKCLLRK
jgi:hypothetical protein